MSDTITPKLQTKLNLIGPYKSNFFQDNVINKIITVFTPTRKKNDLNQINSYYKLNKNNAEAECYLKFKNTNPKTRIITQIRLTSKLGFKIFYKHKI